MNLLASWERAAARGRRQGMAWRKQLLAAGWRPGTLDTLGLFVVALIFAAIGALCVAGWVQL